MIDTSIKNIYSVVDFKVNVSFGEKQILSCKALKLIADLHLNFNDRRLELIALRDEKRVRINKKSDDGVEQNSLSQQDGNFKPSFNLSGFGDRKIAIWGLNEINSKKNLLDSSRGMFLIHFESDNSHVLSNLVEAQLRLKESVSEVSRAALAEDVEMVAVAEKELSIMVSPRNLNLDEKNIYINGDSLSAAFFDAGLFLHHNAKNLVENGSIPYLYLNNIENYYEAKFWNEIISYVEEELLLLEGTIKTMITFDSSLAAFERDHINEELKLRLVN
jgi:malate synthase